MRRARVVIGSAFGDEGKGLMVDYFCRQVENPIVIRFNGGAQAGHTVITPDGRRHVFHHFGAGTFAGADTFLSMHFLVNPVTWKKEFIQLQSLIPFSSPCDALTLYVHPFAPVTTVYDMFVNQKLEESRTKRHGSCGMGVNETMVRQKYSTLTQLFASDLRGKKAEIILERVRVYAIHRLHIAGLDNEENLAFINNDDVFTRFLCDCQEFAKNMILADASYFPDRDIIFEGAQGLLLDSENKRFFPHVTHSRTGLTNVGPIAQRAGVGGLDVTYVARTYLTRHGAGELPGEDPGLSYEDTTNVDGPWQGSLRFARQEPNLIQWAIHSDILNFSKIAGEHTVGLAVTHMDQKEYKFDLEYVPTAYVSYGATHKDVQTCPGT